MIRFLKTREAGAANGHRVSSLGPLEASVMRVVWARGEAAVREVMAQLDRPLAYTTVMTTLDRLFKKGLLERRKADRAFLYSPRFTRREWERKLADELVAGFLAGPAPSRERLLSFFIDAVGQHDEALLEELEKKIRTKRRELCRRGAS